ncbi:MAG: DUF2264 domain-containing protein [Clostridia bacterium]|nr:DUF2264 domain-containing protein [Clostridia bacterium]
MLSRNEIKEYALKICIPLMERNARRDAKGDLAFKPDQVGYVPAFLENFCRPFWGITPILAGGEEININVDGKKISILDYLINTLNRGLSHNEEYSWDRYKKDFNPYAYENQNITELAGLMLGLFFARERLWEPLSKDEKDLYAKEIYEMAEVAFDHSWPNNHYWFPLFTFTVLKRFGYNFERIDGMLEYGLEFLDSLYIDDGWYKDGAFGRFDYYEAWSLHLYPLLWTLIADETFKDYEKYKNKYIERTNAFIDYYTHWFAADGANVPFGRSLSYRFAACALFPAAVLAGCDINPSLAGRITAKNIEFFKNNVKNEESDIIPEGYLYQSPCVIEGYTSDGGAYWCCKSFLALLMDENHPFWDYDKAELPSEKGDFLVNAKHKDINILFEGHNGIVNMYNNTAQYYYDGKMTHRFGNVRNWYSKFVYNSATGFGCSGVDNISIDSMIALETKDLSMTSHRFGFEDMGYNDGVLHSKHIPFANDQKSTIETWLVPLNGCHVRIHKVKLDNEYFVKEGGFSVSSWDDYKPVTIDGNFISIANHEYVSLMKTVSDVEFEMAVDPTQASYHMYAPLAAYPVFTTKEVLKPGEYIFASAFAVKKATDGDFYLPEMKITDSGVVILNKSEEKIIKID